MNCFGLIIWMHCIQPEPLQLVDSFCEQTRTELRSLRLTEEEVNALREVNIDKLLSLKNKYAKLCTEKEEVK